MRYIATLLFSSLLVMAAGCSAPQATPDVTPPAVATLEAYQPGSPVETTAEAVTVANTLFEEKGGAHWIEPPQTVFVEEMSYAEAVERLGVGEGEYTVWPPETRVWLVVFKGRWQLVPLDPSQANPPPVTYEGCGFTLFTAQSGEWMSMGDATCPGN